VVYSWQASACARLGCITEADYQQAVQALGQRLLDLLEQKPVRAVNKGELAGCLSYGQAKVERFSLERAAKELGDHGHDGAQVGAEQDAHEKTGSEATTWQAIVWLDSPTPLPAFPVDSLPKILRDYVKGVAAETQTPEDAAAMLSLAILAAGSIGKARVHGSPGHAEELMLYVVIVMASAERKTPLFTKLMSPLRYVEKSMRDNQIPDRDEARARHAVAKRNLEQLQRRVGRKPGKRRAPGNQRRHPQGDEGTR
jgi:hypothetical protein